MVENAIYEKIKKVYDVTEYPALHYQIEQWHETRPFMGLKVLDATPVYRNTLVKYIPLLAGGAQLSVGISDIMAHDKNIVEFLTSIGIDVYKAEDRHRVSFDIIMDCAASFSGWSANMGYVEITRSGVDRYKASGKAVYVVDSGRIKRIETSLGTGESYFRAMAKIGYSDWNGKNLVVFGSGKVGRGIIMYAYRYGANVTVVTDPDSVDDKIKEWACRIVDFHKQQDVENAVKEAYAIVTATGVPGAVQKSCSPKVVISSNAILANMGVEDEFGPDIPAERVLNGKATINFSLEEPTHLKYIDATMALHNAGALYIAQNPCVAGLVTPDAETENELLRVSYEKGIAGPEIAMIL